MKKDALKLTSADMDKLWGLAHKAKDDKSVVKLDRGTLVRLLIDHGKLLNYFEGKPENG